MNEEKRQNKGTAGNPCQRPSSILNRSLFSLAGLPEFYRYPKKSDAMNLRSIFDKRLAPGPELKQIFEYLLDAIDGPESLQYAIVDAYLSLRSQAHRDGWMNWSDWYEECLDLIAGHVPEGSNRAAESVRLDIAAIRDAGQTGADEGRFGYEELDRLAPDVIHWYHRHKKLIGLPDGANSWIDTIEKRGDNKSCEATGDNVSS